MSNFCLSTKSKEILKGVHPHLAAVVEKAITITTVDFSVIEGIRTEERQRILFKSGASGTLRSRHLTGHAVDLGAWVDGRIDWSWPLYHKIAKAMKLSANMLDIPIEWGGDWKTFPDGPHYQLPWSIYPITL
jgi:peptidoglycan L-alanyl-D-glutamate endopeptidase CwlK